MYLMKQKLEASFLMDSSKWKHRVLWLFYILCLSFFIVMQSPNNIWHQGDTGTDSTVFKYVAYEIQNGNMPYSDTFDHKGPLVFLLNIAGNLIGAWRGIWVVELIFMFIGLLFIYKIARLYCDNQISAILTFLVSGCIFKYFEGGNLTEEYAIPFIAAGICLFMKYLDGMELKNYEFAICGGAFSCVLLLRPNMGVLWPVMCLGIVLRLLHEQSYQELIKIIKWFLAGMAVILVPVLIWLGSRGAMPSFIEAFFQYNVTYTKALSASNSRYTAFSYYLSDSIVTIVTMATVLLVIIKHRMKDILYMCFFLLNLMMISMAGKISMHYGMIIVPTLIYPLAALAKELKELSKEKSAGTGISILMILVLSPYVIPGWITCITSSIEQFPGRHQDYISVTNKEIVNLIVNHSEDDDEITVCGNWNIIYLLSNRRSASRYSYQTVCSIDEDMENEYFDDLKEKPPEIIVLRNDFYAMEKMTKYLETESYEDIGGDAEGVARVLKRSNADD